MNFTLEKISSALEFLYLTWDFRIVKALQRVKV
jgi:hypothetical protein